MSEHKFAKHGKITAFLAIAAMMALLTCTLCGCNLFDQRTAVKSVYVTVSGARQGEDGVYSAQLGKSVAMTVQWDNVRVKNPSVQWYVSINGEEKKTLEGQTDIIYTFVFEELTEDVFEYSVQVNETVSAEFKVKTVYADVSAPEIKGEGCKIIQNVIQLNVKDALPENIILSAEWNEKYINPNTKCEVKWYIGSVEFGEGSTFVYKVLRAVSPTVIEINCRVYFGDDYTLSVLKIEYVTIFNPVDEVRLNLLSGASLKDGGFFQPYANKATQIDLSASVEPSTGTNLGADCVWQVRNTDGTTTLENTSRNAAFTPKKGKNVITATIDNVISANITLYVLSLSDFDEVKAFAEDTYIWNGQVQDKVLTDQYDFNCFIPYLVSLNKSGADNALEAYVLPTELRNRTATQSMLADALNCVDESGYYKAIYILNGGVFTVYLDKTETMFGEPLQKYDSDFYVQEAREYNHLVGYASSRNNLPIDDVIKTMTVETSNQLYRAVEWGYRPVFADTEKGRATQAIYNNAREILNAYILDEMSEYEKALIIYEWIVCNVKYDYALVQKEGETSDKIIYNAYFLEGVFNDGIAVCDGKSKAFALLCGMEGIRCVRIVGKASTDSGEGGHAWNKILLDVDNDSVREWFVVDTTWGDSGSGDKKQGYVVEYLTYEYFLTNDAYISETHHSQNVQPAAKTSFEAYRNIYAETEKGNVSLYISSYEQLKQLVAFGHKIDKCLQVKLAPAFAKQYGINNYNDFVSLIRKIKLDLGYGDSFSVLNLDAQQPIYIFYAKSQN